MVVDVCSLELLVLDPNIKNAYALDKWDAESYAAGIVQLEKVVSAVLFILLSQMGNLDYSLICITSNQPKNHPQQPRHHVRCINCSRREAY